VLAAASQDAVGQVFTLSDGVGVPYREFFAPHAELIGRRLVTLPGPVAIASASVIRHLVRLTPADNEINAASARYLLRKGTYSNAKARRVLGWEPRVGVQKVNRRMAARAGLRGDLVIRRPRPAQRCATAASQTRLAARRASAARCRRTPPSRA
jgi:nucleoside-diphosphate-sugar epimerase